MKVGIVGMGAAGIHAAHLLERAGVDLRLFEARDRVGGRLLTVNDRDTALYDAGGEWIEAHHSHAMEFARSHGIEPAATPRWQGFVLHKGEVCQENDLWTEALEDELRLSAAAAELCRSIDSKPWLNPELGALDGVTLSDFITQNAQSDRGRWWLTAKYRAATGDDPDRTSLLGWLLCYQQSLNREEDATTSFRIPIGAGALFERAAQRLRTPILFEKVLQRVIRDEDKVVLQFDDGETTVDRLLLALPPPAIERIVIDPAMPREKRCAFEACEMSRMIKICLVFDEAWWVNQNWAGSLVCDMPIQQTWDGSKDGLPVLSCTVCGRDADYFLHNPQAVQAAISQLSEFMPVAATHFVRGVMYDWINDSFGRGAFPHLAPGFAMNHLEHIATPIGRVHFAGDYATTRFGTIDGALESAERAVKEMLDA